MTPYFERDGITIIMGQEQKEKAQTIGQVSTSLTPYYERNGITIFCGDCLEVMPKIDGVFDAIIADLPYG